MFKARRGASPRGRVLATTNKERIIETALELFNVRGVQRVSTNHIAEHLSISPGNLYYHFANKEEIVRAIFPRIEGAVHAAIVLPEEPPISAVYMPRVGTVK